MKTGIQDHSGLRGEFKASHETLSQKEKAMGVVPAGQSAVLESRWHAHSSVHRLGEVTEAACPV